MELQNFMLEKEGQVAVVRFNRPKALNALNSDTLKELDALTDQLAADEDVQVVVFTGEGKSFIAGADISEMAELGAEGGRAFGALGQRIFRKIELIEKPTIAAVNGFALGGGCEFAMCCDIRIASEKAKFGQPEVGLGITPGFSGTQRLPKLVGVGKAKELIFTGDMIRADEALAIGLVNKVTSVDELMPTVMEMAKRIARNAPLAVRYAKLAIDRGMEQTQEVGNEIEAAYFGMCFASEDQKEGMRAFMSKEKATFTGK